MAKKKIAIIGSGCSGLGALWALKNTEHELHLYEAGARLGGHTNTVEFEGRNRNKTNVDTGFIVFNTATYPNFIAFLKEVGVPAVPTEMTFGVSRDSGLFEWAGTSLSSIFADKRNIFTLRMWRLIFDIVRFNQFALDLLIHEEESEGDPTAMRRRGKGQFHRPRQQSIGDYLEQEGYSETFRDDYLIPMTAAVWSTSPDKCSLQFPAITLVRFLWNHHLLNTIGARPTWMTIPGGTKKYIDKIMKDVPEKFVHLNTRVTGLNTLQDGTVILETANRKEMFHHVIVATHGDQALNIVRPSATKQELDILSGFKTSRNVAILHSDLTLMPKRRIAWSSWNYLTASSSKRSNVSSVCLTYNMNILQHIPQATFGDVLVTLNPLLPPDPRLVQGIWEYNHPLYNAEAIHSQQRLGEIQNTRAISYCGAWTKYGFHEDGFSSGLKVAMEHLGAKLPFEFVDSTFSRGRRPALISKDHAARIVILLIQLMIQLWGMLMGWIEERRRKSLKKLQ